MVFASLNSIVVCFNSLFFGGQSPGSQIITWRFILSYESLLSLSYSILNLFYIPTTVCPPSSPPVPSPHLLPTPRSTPQKGLGFPWKSTNCQVFLSYPIYVLSLCFYLSLFFISYFMVCYVAGWLAPGFFFPSSSFGPLSSLPISVSFLAIGRSALY